MLTLLLKKKQHWVVFKNNFVYFNGKPGTVLSATTSQLVVSAPNVVADTVFVKMTVLQSDKFSNIYQYKLVTAWEEYYPFDPVAEKAYGIIIDNSGNINATSFNTASDYRLKENIEMLNSELITAKELGMAFIEMVPHHDFNYAFNLLRKNIKNNTVANTIINNITKISTNKNEKQGIGFKIVNLPSEPKKKYKK